MECACYSVTLKNLVKTFDKKMQNNIIIFIHLLAAIVAIGGSIYSLLISLPAAEKNQKKRDENSPSYKILDLLAPTVFACLLIMVGSGVYFL